MHNSPAYKGQTNLRPKVIAVETLKPFLASPILFHLTAPEKFKILLPNLLGFVARIASVVAYRSDQFSLSSFLQ